MPLELLQGKCSNLNLYQKLPKLIHVFIFSLIAMIYTLVIVKDSRKLKEARLEREAIENNEQNNVLYLVYYN